MRAGNEPLDAHAIEDPMCGFDPRSLTPEGDDDNNYD